MPVPLLDLTRQYKLLQAELEAAALGVLRSGKYILGDEVSSLEKELAAYLGCAQVVGLSSGTDALLAPLMALGVQPGDEVVVPVYSFFATAGVVSRLGATPVFVDVEPVWHNLDPQALGKALERHRRVKAIVPVHLYGAPCDMVAITALGKARGIPIVEDACQAIGTRSGGRMAGTLGLCGAFSTFPSKNLGGPGDGGFLATDDEGFAARIRQLRMHGQSDAYRHESVGGNFRLDALQAAILRVKLRHLESWTRSRRDHAARYRELFAAAGLERDVRLPADVADRHTYHQYVVHLPPARRDAVRLALTERGIGCAVYYPLPFHLQPCWRGLGGREGQFPVAEAAAKSNLALPVFPELTDGEQQQVVAAIAAALR